jgi:ribosome maturation factor RimP
MGIPETVMELLDSVVATIDVELVDVEYNGNTLRVIVDQPNGISTGLLAKVNRLVSPILDEHDPVPGRYTLEVTSPGVERNLSRPEHYQRAVGEDVVLKMYPGVDPRRIKGMLTESIDDRLVVEVREIDGNNLNDPERHVVSLSDVAKARTFFDWGPTPKPGGPSKNSNNQKRKSSTQKKSSMQKNKRTEKETP